MRATVVTAAVDASADAFARVLRDVHDESNRARLRDALGALGNVARSRAPARRARARARRQARHPRDDCGPARRAHRGQREQARRFFRDHQAAILARLPTDDTTGQSLALARLFLACDATTRDDAVAYVTATFGKLPGARRALDQGIEAMDQCIARRAVLAPVLRGWLTGVKIPKPPKTPKASVKK